MGTEVGQGNSLRGAGAVVQAAPEDRTALPSHTHAVPCGLERRLLGACPVPSRQHPRVGLLISQVRLGRWAWHRDHGNDRD